MSHGTEAYFLERSRFHRRLSGFIVGVGATLLAGHYAFWLLTRSPVAPTVLREVPILRWGFEGREQFVRRIQLKTEGAVVTREGLQAQYVPASKRGGRVERPRPTHPNAPAEPKQPRDEEGDSEVDRLARARASMINVPLVRSEDLIIERLVRPEYPMDARERGIEGKVAVLALVDTLGEISSVEVVGSSEGGILERAAEEAVWKCRFRPYQIDGQPQRVYAMFRFAFRLE